MQPTPRHALNAHSIGQRTASLTWHAQTHPYSMTSTGLKELFHSLAAVAATKMGYKREELIPDQS